MNQFVMLKVPLSILLLHPTAQNSVSKRALTPAATSSHFCLCDLGRVSDLTSLSLRFLFRKMEISLLSKKGKASVCRGMAVIAYVGSHQANTLQRHQLYPADHKYND